MVKNSKVNVSGNDGTVCSEGKAWGKAGDWAREALQGNGDKF